MSKELERGLDLLEELVDVCGDMIKEPNVNNVLEYVHDVRRILEQLGELDE